MIIDLNASLGHYPFRQLGATTAGQLIALMNRNGIQRAVVPSLHAVFYRDAQRANEELLAETKPHADRLIPVPTVNPKYVGWERDFADCLRAKPKAIALAPEHHGYTLVDEHGRAALAKIVEHGVPVLLTQRLEDRRQRHAWDRAEELSFIGVIEAARAYPTLKFLLVNWLSLDGRRMVDAGMKGRCLLDFARLQVIYRKDVPRLIESLGVEAIAFGSHMPFDYVGASLVKLENVQLLRPADYEPIAWRNAARFLGLDA